MSNYRQGEVVLAYLDDNWHGEPRDLKEPLVLAQGAQGNAHQFPKGAAVREVLSGGKRFVEVYRRTTLRHPTHRNLMIKPGRYEVRIGREYTPEEIRQVAD